MVAASSKVLFQPGVGYQATPPLFMGALVTSRPNHVISQQSTSEPDSRPRFSLSSAGRKREGVSERARERTHKAGAKWNLAYDPRSVTVLPPQAAPGYKKDFNVIFKMGYSRRQFSFQPGMSPLVNSSQQYPPTPPISLLDLEKNDQLPLVFSGAGRCGVE